MSEIPSSLWDLNRLNIFVAVAKHGSLKAASIKLGAPQPAISRQIARLEAECKGRLFDRTGRGMVLTELGTKTLPLVERLLSEAQALTHSLNETGGLPFGDVRIGALPSLYRHVGVPLFFELRARYPGIRLQFFEGSAGQIDTWLAAGTLDLGLPYRYGASTAPEGDPIFSADSCLIGPAGDRLTKNASVAFKLLDGLPLVLPSAPSGVRTTLDKLARKQNIKLNIVVEADSTQLQTTITALRGAYTVLPELAVTDAIDRGELQASHIVDPVIVRQIKLVQTNAHPPSYATRTVAKVLREIVSKSKVLKQYAE
ncbi:LysR family transcriptional regulator [Alcaligenaceae bacterium]|nr:LysR family transcriptional regulator [Alcaligenaceae bacterium]